MLRDVDVTLAIQVDNIGPLDHKTIYTSDIRTYVFTLDILYGINVFNNDNQGALLFV